MEKGIALSVIYVILALVHGLGLILNSSLLLDLAIPSGKTPLVVCHTLTSITLFSSDVLVLMDLFNNIGVSKLGAVSSYFDFYSGLSFFVIFFGVPVQKNIFNSTFRCFKMHLTKTKNQNMNCDAGLMTPR